MKCMVLHIHMGCYLDNVMQANDCKSYNVLYIIKLPCSKLSLQTCTECRCFIFIGY